MGRYTDEPVDEIPELPTGPNTDWRAVGLEYKRFPNKWIRLKIERYTNCSNSNAKYAMHKLRQQGLQADKREHYQEFPGVPDPITSEPTTLRNPLGVFSVWGMYFEPNEQESNV